MHAVEIPVGADVGECVGARGLSVGKSDDSFVTRSLDSQIS